jgi:23S rRNA (cytosine1962-C5)-methyltransferase
MDDGEHEAWLRDCVRAVAEMTGVAEEEIFVRERRKMNHREQGQYEKLDGANRFFKVEEGGLQFLVNLGDYVDTGLFLDHRATRQMVRAESAARRVLNLFCYTGSFSVYAAAGGAGSVTSVDLSKTYLNWAEDNFAINHFTDKGKYFFIHADVKQWLKTLEPNSFDLVVMDPPTFSNSKRMKDFLDVQRDHVELINDALGAVSANGALYFSTNFSKFVLDEKNIKAAAIKDITRATTPFDFEGKLKRWCYRMVKEG